MRGRVLVDELADLREAARFNAALIFTNGSHFSGSASSGKIASTGHSGSQAPQSMHSSRIDHEHALADVDAVDGAHVDAGEILDVDARLGDHVRHRKSL